MYDVMRIYPDIPLISLLVQHLQKKPQRNVGEVSIVF